MSLESKYYIILTRRSDTYAGWQTPSLEDLCSTMATHVLIHNCTVEDTEFLARNNMTAFWEMTWWRMLWIDTSLDTIIKNSALRMPHNLLTGRLVRRHQKVIDHGTGQIIGYARWILPEVCAPCWLEAQTPDVSEDNKRVFENQFAEASWAIRDDMPGFDDHLEQMMKRNSPTEPYISELLEKIPVPSSNRES